MKNILDELKIDNVIPAQDVGTADVDSASGSFKTAVRARKIAGYASSADLTVGQTLTVQLLQATSAAGASAKVLGSAVTQTAAGTEAGQVKVEVSVDAMDSAGGFTFVGLRVGSSANGKVGQGTLIRLVDDCPAN